MSFMVFPHNFAVRLLLNHSSRIFIRRLKQKREEKDDEEEEATGALATN